MSTPHPRTRHHMSSLSDRWQVEVEERTERSSSGTTTTLPLAGQHRSAVHSSAGSDPLPQLMALWRLWLSALLLGWVGCGDRSRRAGVD